MKAIRILILPLLFIPLMILSIFGMFILLFEYIFGTYSEDTTGFVQDFRLICYLPFETLENFIKHGKMFGE